MFSAVKLDILTWESMGPTPFWSQPLEASRWIAVLVTSVLVSREGEAEVAGWSERKIPTTYICKFLYNEYNEKVACKRVLAYRGTELSLRACSTSMSSLWKSTMMMLKLLSLVSRCRSSMSEMNCWTQRAWFFTVGSESTNALLALNLQLEFVFILYCVPVWLSGRALRLLRKRLWVRFPGNTCTNENV